MEELLKKELKRIIKVKLSVDQMNKFIDFIIESKELGIAGNKDLAVSDKYAVSVYLLDKIKTRPEIEFISLFRTFEREMAVRNITNRINGLLRDPKRIKDLKIKVTSSEDYFKIVTSLDDSDIFCLGLIKLLDITVESVEDSKRAIFNLFNFMNIPSVFFKFK